MRVAVLSTGRQDWGALRSTCRLLQTHPKLELSLILGGMHCAKQFGMTIRDVEQDGFVPTETLKWVPDTETPAAYDQAGAALRMIAEALQRQKADALMILGDRFETAAAALAATLIRIPIIHLHGGEETMGAFDNALRHSITKLSHLHLVSHPSHAERVLNMGEDPTTIHVVGSPGLDNLNRTDLAQREELESFLGLSLRSPLVMVTLHPATLGDDPAIEAEALCGAMDQVQATYVIMLPNTDPGYNPIRMALSQASQKPNRIAVDAIGERRYWGLMLLADAMAGNSSSGIIEAPSIKLPVVNIGKRQLGRMRATNVVDTPPVVKDIAAGLNKVLDPRFRKSLSEMDNPWGDGKSAERIINILSKWTPPSPPIKPGIRVTA